MRSAFALHLQSAAQAEIAGEMGNRNRWRGAAFLHVGGTT
jgi:hypothetical protein